MAGKTKSEEFNAEETNVTPVNAEETKIAPVTPDRNARKEIIDPNAELVPYTLPIDPNPKASQQEFYSYNFKNYIIKRGVQVMIPKGLRDIIEEQNRARLEELRYILETALKEPSNK